MYPTQIWDSVYIIVAQTLCISIVVYGVPKRTTIFAYLGFKLDLQFWENNLSTKFILTILEGVLTTETDSKTWPCLSHHGRQGVGQLECGFHPPEPVEAPHCLGTTYKFLQPLQDLQRQPDRCQAPVQSLFRGSLLVNSWCCCLQRISHWYVRDS